MIPRIVGIAGGKGHGKNTAGAALAAPWQGHAFANPIRAALYALNPTITRKEYDEYGDYMIHLYSLQQLVDKLGWDVAKCDYSEVRELLQRFGTEVGRKLFGPDFWVDRAMNQIDENNLTHVYFTDVRFPNEAIAIKERGGIVIRIINPRLPVNTDTHASEVPLPNALVDVELENSGTIEELQRRFKEIVEALT